MPAGELLAERIRPERGHLADLLRIVGDPDRQVAPGASFGEIEAGAVVQYQPQAERPPLPGRADVDGCSSFHLSQAAREKWTTR